MSFAFICRQVVGLITSNREKIKRESSIIEEHMMGDHVYMLLSIPSKYSVSQVVGYIKGGSAIHIARTYAGKRCN
jgi:putative transposase